MSELFLMKGNEALAEAAIRCGCRYFFGYPITPQTEISAYMTKHLPKAGGVYLQAESEIAAANMVLGASAAGTRVMTSSSSPGISLKSEAISYIAASDLPCVIVNVMRGGPGLGGIQPSQADYWQATRAAGHGDFHLLVYAPNSVQEMVDLTIKAFDMADTYRVPAMILADGLLGQMMEPVTFPDYDLSSIIEKPWATSGTNGKRKPNIVNSLILQPDALERSIRERFSRYDTIAKEETMVESFMTEDADFVVVAYGATARIAKHAVLAARKQGHRIGLVRPITVWPFPYSTLRTLSKQVRGMLAVEMSMGQMVQDVRLAVNGQCPVHFYGRTGGVVPTPEELLEVLLECKDKKEADDGYGIS